MTATYDGPNKFMRAYVEHQTAAHAATESYAAMIAPTPLVKVPGADTAIRMAWRIHSGLTIEQAVAREYLYRWSLALTSRVFGPAPHTLGL